MDKNYGPMTDERKTRIWKLWRQGLPMSDIAKDIVKPPATVYSYLLYHGGIEPSARTPRAECLSFDDRATISRCHDRLNPRLLKMGRVQQYNTAETP